MRAIIFLFTLAASPALASEAVEAPWQRPAFDIETGVLLQVGDNTNLDYTLVQTELTYRAPYTFQFDMAGGSNLIVRSQWSFIGTWFERGPEDYYIGISGGPSIEWWCPENTWALYFSIGGGFGLTNSSGPPDGLGQDFTLNWFAKTGIRYQVTDDFSIYGGPFFRHMSNGGMTEINPGIDALGITIGASFSF